MAVATSLWCSCAITIEKLLKAAIVEADGIEPPKIHNLTGLLLRANLNIADQHRPLVHELNTMSVVTRYPDGRRAIASALTLQHTSELYERTVKLAEWLKQELTSANPSGDTPPS